ncbi:zinc finger BED domain-containing protein RICESLEEPER 2-like isoform X1 [Phoenix dactylifera]|uniref:Zinc finger BED domain-containing protein RICESLEEPER 2-like isoform X1 n=2 Tax=Phoenix dactylifera TaxID=42345 RepID=A0A8B9A409_PHODC|nr:zinc finger BED domain-containing protein RICESLEEPER 2-like isoform X1 [Phoenix dactylifera]XP_038982613.1 zinc finger BED domain-containing protein RICESLEEPER 2-like isoform X1 [Phoenix dactylifera]
MQNRLMSTMDSNENMAEVSSVLRCGSSQAIEPSNTDSSKTNKRKRSEIWNHYCEERSREDLARMVILQEMPFTTVEHPAFQMFIRNLRPEFHIVSRTTLSSDCFKTYEKEKRRLEDLFKTNCGRISLTSDMWTSNQTLGYMCLTAHYITNDWKLKKHIINFKLVPSPHTGLVISDAIANCILSWNIEKRLGSITLDNLSANTVVATELQKQFRKDLLLDGKFFHVRCCAHILNLIVKDGLKVVEGAIHRIREAVKYIKSSQGRLELFMGIVKQFKMNGKKRICIDVPTRWNSTYLMLNDAIEFKDVFMRLVARDPNFDNAPTEEDWSQGIIICNFLKVFHLITEVFSQTKNPTANLYFYEIWRINMLLIEESRSSNAVVMMMALKMQEKFDKYWKECSHILAVGVVLDPRHKMNLIIYCFHTIHGNGDRASFEINKVREVLQTFYDNYAILYGTNVSLVQVDERVSTSQGGRDENRFMHGYKEFIHGVQVTQPSKSELETYLEEKVHPLEDQNFDILQYWKFNESKYPILSRMVRDILAIPVSTVASESAFSTAGRVLDDFRSSLSPNTVEVLICAQDWLRDSLPHLADIPPPHTKYKVEDYETVVDINTDD